MCLHFGLYVFVFGLPTGDRMTYESDAMSQKKKDRTIRGMPCHAVEVNKELFCVTSFPQAAKA